MIAYIILVNQITITRAILVLNYLYFRGDIIGYVLTVTPTRNVKDGLVQASTVVSLSKFQATTSYITIFDATVNLANVNTLHYTVEPPNVAGDVRIQVDGNNTDAEISANTVKSGTVDVSSYTSEVNVKMQVKLDSSANIQSAGLWFTAS